MCCVRNVYSPVPTVYTNNTYNEYSGTWSSYSDNRFFENLGKSKSIEVEITTS